MFYRKPGGQPTLDGSKLVNAGYERGDELQGQWPREQLVRVDADFCARMERAIERGLEKRENVAH